MSMGVDPKWVDVSGVGTRYFDAGQGDAILLITGGNFGSPEAASTVEIWDRNVAALAKRYRVIVPDKLGQGFTDNPLRDDDYTMDAVIEHIRGFIEALRLDAVHMVGQSRGAMPVAASTYLFPERVRSCTIINTSTLAPGIGLNEVALAGCPYGPYTRESQRWLFEECASDKRVVTDDFVQAGYEVLQLPKYRQSCTKMVEEGLKAAMFVPRLQVLKREILERLAESGTGRPVQIVWGVNDKTATVDRAVALYDLIAAREKHASLTLVNDAGHHPFREHPDQFNEIMLRFLGGLR